MSKLSSAEQARLETLLAQGHRILWRLADIYLANDQYEIGDDLTQGGKYLSNLMEAELKKGKGLRTRPRIRA